MRRSVDHEEKSQRSDHQRDCNPQSEKIELARARNRLLREKDGENDLVEASIWRSMRASAADGAPFREGHTKSRA